MSWSIQTITEIHKLGGLNNTLHTNISIILALLYYYFNTDTLREVVLKYEFVPEYERAQTSENEFI